jgi:hypothetical protein
MGNAASKEIEEAAENGATELFLTDMKLTKLPPDVSRLNLLMKLVRLHCSLTHTHTLSLSLSLS